MNAPIKFENPASSEQSGWVFVGLPAEDMPKSHGWLSDGKDFFPFTLDHHGIRAYVKMPAQSQLKLSWISKGFEPGEFHYHPAIAGRLFDIAPRFFIGTRALPATTLTPVRLTPSAQIWNMRTHDPQTKITVDCWVTVTSGMSTMSYVTHATYGTTANDGQPQVAHMPAPLTMASAARMHDHFWMRNGKGWAPWQDGSGVHPRGSWALEIAPAGAWHRASRFESRGVLMALEDNVAMECKPICGLYLGWDSQWMALGQIPAWVASTTETAARRRRDYLNPPYGQYDQPRERIQQRNSGQTGEQNDFGCASDLAVVSGEPWEIHDALWQCQGYAIRPTGNKEPGGAPMLASRHPQAVTMNQRPDLNLGLADRLGWPGLNEIRWIPAPETVQWTTSDDQHRADNFLHATIALTRDPALEAIVRDHIELDKTDYYVKNLAVPSPRSVGRLALTRANQVWLGFKEATETMEACIDAALRMTPFGTLPPSKTVRTIGGLEEAKYGWIINGVPVIGWQPWQETIAAIGILAAGKVLSDSNYIQAASAIFDTVCAAAWHQTKDGPLQHAYAIAWNQGDPQPEFKWPPKEQTDRGDAFTDTIYCSSACASWTVAAADFKGDQAILANGPKVRTSAEARWRAI